MAQVFSTPGSHAGVGVFKNAAVIAPTPLELLETRYNSMQAEAKKLGEAIENLKKEEAEAALAPKLLKPVPGEGADYYHASVLGTIEKSTASNPRNRHKGFLSINKRQAAAFAEAINIMAELRTQPGIAAPDGKTTCYTIRYSLGFDKLNVVSFSNEEYQLLSPAFRTLNDAYTAMNLVGQDNIKAAFKTLMFVTPESRADR